MSQAGSYLLNMIHERTKLKLLQFELTAKNYHVWVQMWFETADEMVAEFEAEGLFKTADALEEEIKWQRKRVT